VSHRLKQVLTALSKLHRPDPSMGGGRVFAGAKYPASQFHRLGKDGSGHIAVLLALDPAAKDGPLPPVVLENISVVHSAKCRISDADGNLELGTYTVVSCTSDDKSLVRHFVTLMSSLVLALPDRPSCQTAAAAIQRMIRLFRALQRPSTRSIQGLWAELFVIKMACDAKALVRAWRGDPLERFDFAALTNRLEVKSTKWTRRSHLFSLEQLRTHGDIRVVIASMQVASLANGLTLARLWHDVRSRVEDDAELLLHVDQVVTTSIGRTWRRGLGFGFDDSVARNTLAFYDANSIPAVEGDLPRELSEVRFRSDISAVTPLLPAAMGALGPLFNAAQVKPS
jgi:hypothetical protein